MRPPARGEIKAHCRQNASARGPGDLPGGHRAFGVIQRDVVRQRFIPRLIWLWRRGRFPFDRLLRSCDLRDINRSIAASLNGRTVKPVLRIHRCVGAPPETG